MSFTYSLQKFKLHVANTVITHDNAALSSMDTGDILDLFKLSSDTRLGAVPNLRASGATQSSSATKSGDVCDTTGLVSDERHEKTGLRAMLKDLEELWDEKQYTEEFNMDNFLGSLGSPGSHL